MSEKIKARFLDYIDYGEYDEYDFPINGPKTTLEPGTEFYLIHVFSSNGCGKPRSYSIGQPWPGRTNMSHEERVNGWLGCTDNVDRTADGKWVVREVVNVAGRDQEWVTVIADLVE